MHYISLVPTFFTWWYGRGLKDLFTFLLALFSYIKNMFSVGSLLKTLFQPWKKLVAPRRPGMDGLKDWIVDNFVSRTVGFVMRVIMMFLFIFAFILVLVGGALAIVLWLGMPVVLAASFIYIFVGY